MKKPYSRFAQVCRLVLFAVELTRSFVCFCCALSWLSLEWAILKSFISYDGSLDATEFIQKIKKRNISLPINIGIVFFSDYYCRYYALLIE